MSELFTSTQNNKTVTYFYAIFTKESKQITASAVCLFTMDQIMNSFHGDYKSKPLTQPNEYKLKSRQYNEEQQQEAVPKPRPSPPFHFVSVGLTNMAEYQERPSPCQTASPQSSSQSLNTTTKSSNVSSIHTIDNYKQIQFL